MGGSGKWVKSLVGLKKPDRELDCKVRATRKWFVHSVLSGDSVAFGKDLVFSELDYIRLH